MNAKTTSSGRFGPGLIVAAAFIGPGTITTASVAGARFGYALLWAVAFSLLATLVLQEMSARLGLVGRRDLGAAIRTTFANPLARLAASVLIIAAICIGNAAFEMGNLIGAAIGLESATGLPLRAGAVLIGALVFALLGLAAYRTIERVLIALVGVMGLVFVLTTVIVRPPVHEMLSGLINPTIPSGSFLTVVALIGTTVVPYNLFLHARSVQEKWDASVPVDTALRRARIDLGASIGVGGLVTMAIVSVAAAAFFESGIQLDSAATMATQLEPLMGAESRLFFAIGLLAAGVTSAITAPLAAAYATAGALGFDAPLRDRRFQSIWAGVLVIGTVLAWTGYKPIDAIVFAQVANGILLPVVALFLLIAVNRRALMKEHANGWFANVIGGLVIAIATGLGARSVWLALLP